MVELLTKEAIPLTIYDQCVYATKLNTTPYHSECDGMVQPHIESHDPQHASRYGKWDKHF